MAKGSAELRRPVRVNANKNLDSGLDAGGLEDEDDYLCVWFGKKCERKGSPKKRYMFFLDVDILRV